MLGNGSQLLNGAKVEADDDDDNDNDNDDDEAVGIDCDDDASKGVSSSSTSLLFCERGMGRMLCDCFWLTTLCGLGGLMLRFF